MSVQPNRLCLSWLSLNMRLLASPSCDPDLLTGHTHAFIFSILKPMEWTFYSSISKIVNVHICYQWPFIDGSTIEQKSNFNSSRNLQNCTLKDKGTWCKIRTLSSSTCFMESTVPWEEYKDQSRCVCDLHRKIVASIVTTNYCFIIFSFSILW